MHSRNCLTCLFPDCTPQCIAHSLDYSPNRKTDFPSYYWTFNFDSNQVLVNYQHGCPKNLSCESQLICTVKEIACSLDKGEDTDLIIMDFSKAFDSVPHQRLLMKLRYYGIQGILNTWLTHWLTCQSQSVVIDGYNSPDMPVQWVQFPRHASSIRVLSLFINLSLIYLFIYFFLF